MRCKCSWVGETESEKSQAYRARQIEGQSVLEAASNSFIGIYAPVFTTLLLEAKMDTKVIH